MEDFVFKKLVVWQKAIELAKLVYGLIRHFPVEERYALSDQLRRAVVSIPSNIAEGNGRVSNKDYAHFLSIARGSLFETVTQLELAKNFGYIAEYDAVAALASEVGKMLTAMLCKYGSVEQN